MRDPAARALALGPTLGTKEEMIAVREAKRRKQIYSRRACRRNVFQRILVPVDGSPNSYRGLRYATELADKFGSQITLIHILEQPTYGYAPMSTPIPGKYFADMERFAEELLQKRKKELVGKGLRTNALRRRGSPASEILKASKSFDLVVMGSRGLGRIPRLFLGSVSNTVVQNSKVPVLIVRPDGPKTKPPKS
jgi:nucleotide-binding universal stress UspA family protein